MDVLIVGSNARTGSARYAQRYATFASLIRRAHVAAEDHVEIREWYPALLDERPWDRVYVGLSSPAWIGSDRAYGALLTINEMWGRKPSQQDSRLRLFIDDPNLRTLVNGISSLAALPERFFSEANSKRRDWHTVAASENAKSRIANTLLDLNGWDTEWPTTYVPAFRWADLDELTMPLRKLQKASVRSVDPSPALPVEAICTAANTARVRTGIIPSGDFWIAEGDTDNWWLRSVLVCKPVVTVKPTNDAARAAYYRQAFGVLEPPLVREAAGWWSSRMQLAAATGRYYATNWRLLHGQMPLSAPYTYALPGAYEDLEESDREILVSAQQQALAEMTGTIRDMQEELDVAL